MGSSILAMLEARSPGERSGVLTSKGKALRVSVTPTTAGAMPHSAMVVPPAMETPVVEAPVVEIVTGGGEDSPIVLPTFPANAPPEYGGTIIGGGIPGSPGIGGSSGGGGFVSPPVGGGGGGGVNVPPSPPFEMESPTPMPTETPPFEMESPTPFPPPPPPFEMESPTPMPGVPEPATWAMLIIGFGIIGTAMRRRNARAIA